MERLFEQLIALLARETDLYRALLDILSREKDALLANDADGVLEITRRKDTLAMQIRSLEESRFLLMDKFARALERRADELTLADLSETAPESLRAPLAAARDRLRAAVEQVTRSNDRNRTLVECSMRLLHGAIETIQKQLRPTVSSPAGYGPSRPGGARPVGGVIARHRV